MTIQVGVLGRTETVVSDQNTALAAGSGTLPVFGTPFMAALMEHAAVLALAPFLSAEESSVGTRLNITHDAATPVGLRVWAEAEVTGVDRRRISFSVRAFDECGPIGSGEHERFLIDSEKFLKKANQKAEV